MTPRDKAQEWLTEDIDTETRNEIEQLIAGAPAQLEDAFYKDLEFGTGGMRGVMGAGSNRINKYTLGKAAQGLGNYLVKSFPGEKLKVAIAHDCRNNSDSFARLVAEVLSASNIEVYLFSALRPTPELSFAVRHLHCHSGIVITASHNPSEYNGFKVYWNDGAQIVTPHDKGIVGEVNAIQSLSEVNYDGNSELIHSIDKEIDEAFLTASLSQRLGSSPKHDLKIVFTSLHGTSITLMPELLKRAGYENVFIVEEQAEPDGNFPTVESPNPEERAALDMALKLADEKGADIVIGTDPDADRLGVAVRNNQGEMQLLNGNQCGVLLTEYLLANTALSGNEFIAYTIVSSDMFADVAEHHGCDSKVCLTGFKHIANLIRENEGNMKFLGGGEESYGYMIGDFVRDKDALTSSLLFCDLAQQCKNDGASIMDKLDELFQRHGLYHEHLVSLTKKGKSGSEEIAAMMANFRSNPPAELGGEKIVRLADIQSGTMRDLATGDETVIDLPSSNVLQFYTEKGSKISARPSGTEPKIKFYFSLREERDAMTSLGDQQKILDLKINSMIKDFNV